MKFSFGLENRLVLSKRVVLKKLKQKTHTHTHPPLFLQYDLFSVVGCIAQ